MQKLVNTMLRIRAFVEDEFELWHSAQIESRREHPPHPSSRALQSFD